VSVPLVSVVISTRARPVWLTRAAVCPRTDVFVDRIVAGPGDAHQLHIGNRFRYRGGADRIDGRIIRLNLGNLLE
jgi:hypothetical protein